ncbi:MAG: hypothetical protein V1846_05640 [Candidatus Komeilibacteria bacterium]
MSRGNKIFWVILIVVIVGVIVFLNSKQSIAPTAPNDQNATSTTDTTKTDTNIPAVKPANPAHTITTSYQEMMTKYAGRRIQFNETCQATPSSMTIKNGSQIMFDNRESKPTVLNVDGVAYPTSAYTYRLIYLSSKTLPHTVIVNCGSQNNVAQITLQK